MNFEQAWQSTMGDQGLETAEMLALKKLAHVFFVAGVMAATSNLVECAVATSKGTPPKKEAVN